jgi:hypothetical protein
MQPGILASTQVGLLPPVQRSPSQQPPTGQATPSGMQHTGIAFEPKMVSQMASLEQQSVSAAQPGVPRLKQGQKISCSRCSSSNWKSQPAVRRRRRAGMNAKHTEREEK